LGILKLKFWKRWIIKYKSDNYEDDLKTMGGIFWSRAFSNHPHLVDRFTNDDKQFFGEYLTSFEMKFYRVPTQHYFIFTYSVDNDGNAESILRHEKVK
jgi:hypothetical protein